MKVVHNRLIPCKGYDAINLFGVLFCRKGVEIDSSLLLHERIHTEQMKELLFVGFYLWYVVEWLCRLPMRGNAYMNIGFEREAYTHMFEPDYLSRRKHYAWTHYLSRSRKHRA